MVFPVTPLEPTVEIQLDGTWTDVSDYVYVREGAGITITRGQQDEGNETQPSQCSLTFNNRDGRFSPRNPTSPYYGVLGRNTPLRVSVLLGERRLASPVAGGRATTPDSAALSITGDIDVRVDMRIASWGTDQATIVSKRTDPSSRSWALVLDDDALLIFFWSVDGSNYLSATSTVTLPHTTGRQTVRATLDVDNGAAGRTVTFYTGESVDGPWTQLGDPVVQAGTTSIFDGTGALDVGFTNALGSEVHALKVLQGIGGTERANPDFSVPAEGATSFADAAGNTWTRSGESTVTNRRFRFHGEVSSWPARWDVSGADVWVPVTASGVLRRLGQGAAPLRSPYFRAVTGLLASTLVGYWPMEDEDGAATIASGLSGGAPMTYIGTPELASDDRFVASLALPVLGATRFYAAAQTHSATGESQTRFLAYVPSGTTGTICSVYFTGGTIARADLVVGSGGSGTLRVLLYDSPGTLLASTAITFFDVYDGQRRYSIELEQNGADVDFGVVTLAPGTVTGASAGATAAAQTLGAASAVVVTPSSDMTGVVLGHVSVEHTKSSIYDLFAVLDGHAGEPPGRRIERLCDEEGIGFTAFGYLGPASAFTTSTLQEMGPQTSAVLSDLIGEAVTTDLGALIEPRHVFGLGYRPRETLYSQLPALELDYDNLADLEPVEDDQQSRNDVTVVRADGSSARQVQESGPLSILAPPDGIGLYDDQVSISVQTDSALANQANWRLHLGTVDEARYPTITAYLEAPDFSADSALTSAALDLEQGDLIEISNPPTWLPPDTIRQLALGFTETIEPFSYSIQINCAPASPWDVPILDDSELSRLDSETTTLAADITSTATSATIAIATGSALWVTTAANPAEFPFDVVVGGEVMTVTACTGVSSPQTFTVTRSVNGVVKTHAAGAQVRLARPVFLAL